MSERESLTGLLFLSRKRYTFSVAGDIVSLDFLKKFHLGILSLGIGRAGSVTLFVLKTYRVTSANDAMTVIARNSTPCQASKRYDIDGKAVANLKRRFGKVSPDT